MKRTLALVLTLVFAIQILAANTDHLFSVLVPSDRIINLESVIGTPVNSRIILQANSDFVAYPAPTVQDTSGFSAAGLTITAEPIVGTQDTAIYTIEFTPSTDGSWTFPVVLTNGAHSESVTINLSARLPGVRYSVTRTLLDYGVVNNTYNTTLSTVVRNHTNSTLILSVTTTSGAFTPMVSGVPVTSIVLTAFEEKVLTVRNNPSLLPTGQTTAEITLTDGQPIGSDPEIDLVVSCRVHFVGDGAPLVEINPNEFNFERDPITGDVPDKTFTLRNKSLLDVVITRFYIGKNYSILEVKDLPLLLPGGDSLTFTINRWLANQIGDIEISELVVYGRWLAGGAEVELGNRPVRYIDTLPPSVQVELLGQSGDIGEEKDASLIIRGPLFDSITDVEFSLTYNATMLIPQNTWIRDTTINDVRTTHYRFPVTSHNANSTIATVRFLLALGNTTTSSVELSNVKWFDGSGQEINLITSVLGTTVSVNNAKGFTVNSVRNPLQMRISPRPVSDVATIELSGHTDVATIRIVNAQGVQVLNTTVIHSDEQTAIVNVSHLPRGVYFVQFSNELYSTVSILPVN